MTNDEEKTTIVDLDFIDLLIKNYDERVLEEGTVVPYPNFSCPTIFFVVKKMLGHDSFWVLPFPSLQIADEALQSLTEKENLEEPLPLGYSRIFHRIPEDRLWGIGNGELITPPTYSNAGEAVPISLAQPGWTICAFNNITGPFFVLIPGTDDVIYDEDDIEHNNPKRDNNFDCVPFHSVDEALLAVEYQVWEDSDWCKNNGIKRK